MDKQHYYMHYYISTLADRLRHIFLKIIKRGVIKMGNRILSCVIFIVLGALLAIGPYTIFPVCQDGMMVMRCQNTAKAERAVGTLTAVIGVSVALFKDRKLRIGISIAGGALGLLALLLPNVLIGVCGSKHMTCRALALPAISVVSILIIVFAGLNALYLWKAVNSEVMSNGTSVKHE